MQTEKITYSPQWSDIEFRIFLNDLKGRRVRLYDLPSDAPSINPTPGAGDYFIRNATFNPDDGLLLRLEPARTGIEFDPITPGSFFMDVDPFECDLALCPREITIETQEN